jgi:hypothetical protein
LRIRQVATSPEVESWRNVTRVSGARALKLRRLMKEREEVVTRLVKLDYKIWILEEFLRKGSA